MKSLITVSMAAAILSTAFMPDRAGAAEAAAAGQPAVWQHHDEQFNYSAFTTAYTCDGIEGKVATILRYFGARNPRIRASGCPRGPDSPSHMIWVHVEFDTLAVAAGDAPPAAVVQGQWAPIQLDARRPFFMDEGDCELIHDMKAVMVTGFSFHDLSYESACTPHQVSLQDFRVDGQVLRPLPEHPG